MAKQYEHLKSQVKETLLDTDSEKECVKDDGIYTNDTETCHYYSVLKRLCIKIGFEKDEAGKLNTVYEDGCFAGNEPSFFEDAKRGIYYDFEK